MQIEKSFVNHVNSNNLKRLKQNDFYRNNNMKDNSDCDSQKNTYDKLSAEYFNESN